jgi:Protein of unknown function (DUF3300)
MRAPGGTILTSLRSMIVWVLLAVALSPLPATSQEAGKGFKPEELEQLVAPIALHPDPLLVQVLMASTYPLEVVQAARFVKENPNLKGEQLNEALRQHPWDDSVKSLVTFPQALTMMNDKLDWLQKLGDAFLGQQQELMAAVQRLRARAQASGQLKSTPQQNVIVEPAAAVPSPPQGAAPPPGAPQAPPPVAQAPPAPVAQGQPAPTTVQVVQAPPTIIKIEPANPQVVAVPSYDPTVVYGGWPYPAYPPYYPYPPGYFAAGAFMFGASVAVGAALWSNADWNGGDVNINNSTANNFTNNVNNKNEARARVEHRSAAGGSGTAGQNRGKWQHNPEHRKGVQYRDTATQQRFNKTGPANAQSREAFRGRSGQGSDGGRAAQQGGIGQQGPRASQGAVTRDGAGGLADRSAPQASPRTSGIGQGGGGQARQAGAFEGMGGGRDAQSISSQGRSSRESYSRSSGGSRAGGSAGGGRSGGSAGGGRSGGGGGGGGRSGGGGRR